MIVPLLVKDPETIIIKGTMQSTDNITRIMAATMLKTLVPVSSRIFIEALLK
jgi:hypothetical protein